MDIEQLKIYLEELNDQIKSAGSLADTLAKKAENAFQELLTLIKEREKVERKLANAQLKVTQVRYGHSGIKKKSQTTKRIPKTFDLMSYANSLDDEAKAAFIQSLLNSNPN